MLDVQSIRKDFPILDHKIYDKPLIYFDNGATTQKPRPVVEKIESGYYNVNANIHRGVHTLSQLATDAYEVSREKIQNHINAINGSLEKSAIESGLLRDIERKIIEQCERNLRQPSLI